MNARSLIVPATLVLAACAETVPAPGRAATDAPARPDKAALCVGCHGVHGVSRLPGTPHIAGQDEIYLRESMLRYRSGERPHAPMKAVLSGLDEADIADLARYYALLPRDGSGPAETR